MKTLVVYDSLFGNTEKIALAIGGAVGGEVKRAGEVNPADLDALDLLIVGSPTQGGRAMPSVQELLKQLAAAVKGKDVAAFDTRSSTKWVGIFGYAAGRIAKDLEKAGANLLADPEAFFVKATKGPLKEGEEARAVAWAKGLTKGKE
jgi:flavodoxin I